MLLKGLLKRPCIGKVKFETFDKLVHYTHSGHSFYQIDQLQIHVGLNTEKLLISCNFSEIGRSYTMYFYRLYSGKVFANLKKPLLRCRQLLPITTMRKKRWPKFASLSNNSQECLSMCILRTKPVLCFVVCMRDQPDFYL